MLYLDDSVCDISMMEFVVSCDRVYIHGRVCDIGICDVYITCFVMCRFQSSWHMSQENIKHGRMSKIGVGNVYIMYHIIYRW